MKQVTFDDNTTATTDGVPPKNVAMATNNGPQFFSSLPAELLPAFGVTASGHGQYLATMYNPDGTSCGQQCIKPAEADRERRYHNTKGTKVGLFNAPCLYNPMVNGSVVFVTEGVKDALAFGAMGYYAVATMGTGNLKTLLDTLRHRPPANTLTLALAMDNDPTDSQQAGQRANGELLRELRAMPGIRVVEPDPAMYGEGIKDAADAYLANREALEAFISSAVERAAAQIATTEPEPADPHSLSLNADVGADLTEATEATEDGTEEDRPSWQSMLETYVDRQGIEHYAANFTNYDLVLRNDGVYAGRIRFNALTHDALMRDWQRTPLQQTPATCLPTGTDGECLLHEAHHLLIREDIKARFGFDSAKGFEEGLRLTLYKQAFNPIKEFLANCCEQYHDHLAGMSMNGVPRLGTMFLDTFLAHHLGAECTPLLMAATRLHMAAAVARIYQPGRKYDHMLVLWSKVGGIGKTMLVKELFTPWYQEITLWSGKDAAGALRGQWCANADELNITSKSEASDIKRFITTDTDRYRPPYGRQEVAYPRTCIFWATANHPCALEEAAGNRRFLNFECGVTQPQAPASDIKHTRTQLWAEACYIYKACYSHGEPLVLPREVEADAAANQESSRNVPLWETHARAYTTTVVPANWQTYTPEQRRCYWAWALNYSPMDAGKDELHRINRPWLDGYQAPVSWQDVSHEGWCVIPIVTTKDIMHDLQDAPGMKANIENKVGGLLRSLDYLEYHNSHGRKWYVNNFNQALIQ